MNEESQDPRIDPQLEARIVALVVGEASDFEREELTQLIAQRPELAAFHEQILRAHGVLQDAGQGEWGDDLDDWKLPEERRRAVLSAIEGTASSGHATSDAVVARAERPRISNAKRRRRHFVLSLSVLSVVGVCVSTLWWYAQHSRTLALARNQGLVAGFEASPHYMNDNVEYFDFAEGSSAATTDDRVEVVAEAMRGGTALLRAENSATLGKKLQTYSADLGTANMQETPQSALNALEGTLRFGVEAAAKQADGAELPPTSRLEANSAFGRYENRGVDPDLPQTAVQEKAPDQSMSELSMPSLRATYGLNRQGGGPSNPPITTWAAPRDETATLSDQGKLSASDLRSSFGEISDGDEEFRQSGEGRFDVDFSREAVEGLEDRERLSAQFKDHGDAGRSGSVTLGLDPPTEPSADLDLEFEDFENQIGTPAIGGYVDRRDRTNGRLATSADDAYSPPPNPDLYFRGYATDSSDKNGEVQNAQPRGGERDFGTNPSGGMGGSFGGGGSGARPTATAEDTSGFDGEQSGQQAIQQRIQQQVQRQDQQWDYDQDVAGREISDEQLGQPAEPPLSGPESSSGRRAGFSVTDAPAPAPDAGFAGQAPARGEIFVSPSRERFTRDSTPAIVIPDVEELTRGGIAIDATKDNAMDGAANGSSAPANSASEVTRVPTKGRILTAEAAGLPETEEAKRELPVLDAFNSPGTQTWDELTSRRSKYAEVEGLKEGEQAAQTYSFQVPASPAVEGKTSAPESDSASTEPMGETRTWPDNRPGREGTIDNERLSEGLTQLRREIQLHNSRAQAEKREAQEQVKESNVAVRAIEMRNGVFGPDGKQLAQIVGGLHGTPAVALEALDEQSAADQAFSTFSLHVSDVSFKLSRAALAQGEWPDATTVRIEEFVNAFDYGDPMPSQQEKVACALEQCIHPFLPKRNLLRVSMRTAAAGRAANTPLRLTLLLDNSGSMERSDRQRTVRQAFALLAQQLKPNDQVTLISFARQPRLLADQVGGAQAQQLVDLVHSLPSEGGTNLEAALRLAFEKAREQKLVGAENRIILLTDGAVNLGNADPESLSQLIGSIREQGIAFDAAGIIAEGLNDEILEALTRQGDGRYYLLDSLDDANDGFVSQVAGALRPAAKNVKVQVEFNPERVGGYKLLGFDKHRLNKEDFRNDAVDAAEMAAAESGVALYHFEVNPEGSGDIGAVSVRFQDLTTGQMVEYRWPIPYEPQARRADEATPSMRVAASAGLLAAKLQGGTLGSMVDLSQLSQLLANLPGGAPSSDRILELKQMIQQARQMAGQ